MATLYLILYLLFLSVLTLSSADTYSVKISTEQHMNLVDSRFLSFTIDPKYLFSSSEKYNNKECICMASSLTPAYLRIAGPSTGHMTFRNTTIALTGIQTDPDLESLDSEMPTNLRDGRKLTVSHRQWKKFVQWSKSTGFDLVFALNNEDRTVSGMWDPNTALNILTVAEKSRVGNIYWELGYECTNQSIEEYLNDLETLRVIIETFPPGRTGEWKVVAGDVTKCLQADSKSDFKDYITLSNDMMDALLLNGNSSSHELERMSEMDRLRLLKLLSHSPTPLWLTENTQQKYSELERAADWLASLGYSARNGFSVHYRELQEEEMYEPTLSFYMALLFKNLVGEKVLDLQMDPEQAILFAHCTSLRHKSVPGAVTLFGVNMDDEPARFSLKLSKREEGGDIMQFIMGHDLNGNIVVNGRNMFNEGDIKPIVKRVRPYRTLLINLPSKSFGFWVLANTKVGACQETDENDVSKTLIEAETINEETVKTKRSLNYDFEDIAHIADLSYDFDEIYELDTANIALKNRIGNINKDLDSMRKMFKGTRKDRFKREDESQNERGKANLRKQRQRYRAIRKDEIESKAKGLISNILQNTGRKDVGKHIRKLGNRLRLNKNQINKRNSRYLKTKSSNTKSSLRKSDNSDKENRSKEIEMEKLDLDKDTVTRKRRSIEDITADNDIDFDNNSKSKLWKVLKEIQEQLRDLRASPEKDANDVDESKERLVVKTELSDDGASINLSDSENGLIKSTMTNLISVVGDLNKNLGRFWNAITLLE